MLRKKISNIYDYLDYQIPLNHDFMSRSAANHNYSLRAYARDLGVSPGFLSDILRGKKHLSQENAKSIFTTLGFSDVEIEYVEKLVFA